MFLLYSPLNQGLKHVNEIENVSLEDVFTLQSIKSRIETEKVKENANATIIVFTLQSIKSRIETQALSWLFLMMLLFLLYSPLNQGLKRSWFR